MSEVESYQEPRKFFLTLLIKKVFEAEEQIYVYHTISARPLIGIIDILDTETKKKIEPIRKQLDGYINGKSIVEGNLEKLFSQLCDVLHEGYFKELNLAHPRIKGTGHLE
jgi:hypothetical protein